MGTQKKSTSLRNLKQERTKQWGNNRKIARGWDRFRASTFLEIVAAKIDRCLQCQDLLAQLQEPSGIITSKKKSTQSNLEKKREKLDFDAHDSLLDAYNYLGKLVELVEKDPKFLTDGKMP